MLTCVTLIFALIGASNRMRFNADIHVQKALGMCTDLVGFVSLLSSLSTIRYECDLKIPRSKVTLTAGCLQPPQLKRI